IKKRMPIGKNKKEQEEIDKDYQIILDNNFIYTSLTFDKAEKEILNLTKKNGNTSSALYEARKKVMENKKERAKALNLDFKSSIPKAIRENSEIKKFLLNISKQSTKHISDEENFFASTLATNAINGLSFQKGSKEKRKKALVLMPGFAGHTIKDYIFEEIVIDANKYFDRPAVRPLVDTKGPTVVAAEDAQEFYGSKYTSKHEKNFDILHPVGTELGNSIGANAKNEEDLRKFLLSLTEECSIHLMYEKPTKQDECPALVLEGEELHSYDYNGSIVKEYPLERGASVEILEKLELPFSQGPTFLNKNLCEMITSFGGHTTPAPYKDTDFTLLGYSKGAPIILEMLQKYPELQEKVDGVITFAGVVQGASVAREILGKIESFIGGKEALKSIDKLLQTNPELLSSLLTCVDGNLSTINLNFPALKSILERVGVKTEIIEDKITSYLKTLNFADVISGATDLTPYERIKWHLKYFNDKHFKKKMFFMNMSAINDPSIVVRPRDEDPFKPKSPSPIVPMLNDDGSVAWEHFSPDAAFLYLSSLAGFEGASAGLYDAQVELAHTKSLLLDNRPLSESLTKEELEKLWLDKDMQEIFKQRKITTIEQLIKTPRNKLIPASETTNIKTIDLGEIMGHHWSPFKQALKLPEEITKKYAAWKFPRKAYMSALVQTMSLYNLYYQNFVVDNEE
ncbi:MAG: hypothetical protein HQK51_06675, partial [Oligoflexia bacterium]|nr:hypothetical protein [Oligoflexia bacterium]